MAKQMLELKWLHYDHPTRSSQTSCRREELENCFPDQLLWATDLPSIATRACLLGTHLPKGNERSKDMMVQGPMQQTHITTQSYTEPRSTTQHHTSQHTTTKHNWTQTHHNTSNHNTTQQTTQHIITQHITIHYNMLHSALCTQTAPRQSLQSRRLTQRRQPHTFVA